jgi:PAS domain S-box-containing protein
MRFLSSVQNKTKNRISLAEFSQLVSEAIKNGAEALPELPFDPELEPLAAQINTLLQENKILHHDHRVAVDYIRAKINQMLKVIGTAPLRPEELDEKHLIELDPLGIISKSFMQVLEHSNQTNKKLRLARDEIQAIFDSVAGGLLVMDDKRNILASNNLFKKMFSSDMDNVVGRTCYEVVCGNADTPRESCCFKRMTESGHLTTQPDWQFGDKHFSVAAAPIVDRAGDIVRSVVLYIDITDLIETRAALDDERERLSITLESIADGVIATDDQGRVTLMNRAAELLTGWSAKEAKGQRICSVMQVEDSRPQKKTCTDFFDDIILHKDSQMELFDSTTLIDRQGTKRDIYLSAAPIHQHDRTVAGTIVVFRDITKEKRLEEELARANRLESIGIFAGGIAHDFNNLLTGVLGNVSLAKTIAEPGDRIHHLLNETEKATYRAKGLTQQLLTFAKGGMPVKKLVSAGNLIKESVEFNLRGTSIGYELRIADDLWPLEADEGQINQVIQNLVINSLQAMEEGAGIIKVTAENAEIIDSRELLLDPGRYVKITVTDQGPGIPAEIIDRIFDPFFTTKERGSGLGLASCYSIISKHHGNISVQSEEGRGTSFFLYLPASDEEPAPLIDETPTDAVRVRGRVMVMDDEELVRTVTKNMLEFKGYEVELAKDGMEAIEKYQQAIKNRKPFDVVVMDLTIPGGMGGREAISNLLVVDPKARAIVVSGYSNDPVMADFKGHGFRKVISKPFKLEELTAVIAEVLAEADRA